MRLSFISWMIDRLRGGPALLDAVRNSPFRDSADLGPICHRQSRAFKDYPNISAGVSHLLRLRSPSAILFRVPERVIDSVKSALRARWRSHILVEVLKPLPSFADGNTTTSIISELFEVWSTTGKHPKPALVDDRFAHAVSGGFSFTATSTRAGYAQNELAGANKTEPATVASTEPIPSRPAALPFANKAQNPQAAKLVPDQISSVGLRLVNKFPELLKQVRISVGHRITSNNVDVRGGGALHALRPLFLLVYHVIIPTQSRVSLAGDMR